MIGCCSTPLSSVWHSVSGGFVLLLLSWAVINGPRARTSRKTMRERVPPLQNSKKGHQKWAASPPTLRAGFSSFGYGYGYGGKPDAASAAQGMCQEQSEAQLSEGTREYSERRNARVRRRADAFVRFLRKLREVQKSATPGAVGEQKHSCDSFGN